MTVHSKLMDPASLHTKDKFQLNTGCSSRKVSLPIKALLSLNSQQAENRSMEGRWRLRDAVYLQLLLGEQDRRGQGVSLQGVGLWAGALHTAPSNLRLPWEDSHC